MSKPILAIITLVVFWMVSHEDLILIFHIWVRNTTIEGTMKKKLFWQHFATTSKRLTQKMMI